MRRPDRKGDKKGQKASFFFEEGYLLTNKVEPAIRSRDVGIGGVGGGGAPLGFEDQFTLSQPGHTG